jgi:hypothetical protein
MGELIVTEFVTLDGVAQAPGRPDDGPRQRLRVRRRSDCRPGTLRQNCDPRWARDTRSPADGAATGIGHRLASFAPTEHRRRRALSSCPVRVDEVRFVTSR